MGSLIDTVIASTVLLLSASIVYGVARDEMTKRRERMQRSARYLEAVGILAKINVPDDPKWRNSDRLLDFYDKREHSLPSRVRWDEVAAIRGRE